MYICSHTNIFEERENIENSFSPAPSPARPPLPQPLALPPPAPRALPLPPSPTLRISLHLILDIPPTGFSRKVWPCELTVVHFT